MSQIFDILRGEAFNLVSLTKMVNRLEFLPSQFANDGLYEEIPVTDWTIAFDDMADSLKRFGTRAVGGAPNTIAAAKATLRAFQTYHIPAVDSVKPADIQSAREPGTEQVTTLQAVVARKQLRLVRAMDLTHEWFRFCGIAGIIKEPGDNATTYASAATLLNLQTEFGRNVQTFDMDMDTDATQAQTQCLAMLRLMDAGLGGVPYTGAICYCDATAFDTLLSNDTFRDAFKYTNNAPLVNDIRRGFTFAGITFKEVRQRKISTVNEYIPAGYGYMVPVGAGNMRAYYGPAQYLDSVNTLGTKFYSKLVVALDNSNAELQVQSNPLFINTAPDSTILVKFN